MNNINFDNPWLLLIIVPLLLLIIVAYIVTIKKENRTFNNTFSFICHILIAIMLTLSLAKTTFENVITETNIYVLADVSYSSNNNLDLIDKYIDDLTDNVPKNSKIGIVCFGKDYQLLVDLDEEIKSVKEATVDNSETNIYNALEYTASLFKDSVIKRIVIISDGKETKESNIVSLVNSLSSENIYIDAIYLDNNATEEVKEIQINQIDYVSSTFLNEEEEVNAIIQSSVDGKAILSLYCDDEIYEEKAIYVYKGYNYVSMTLNTKTSGEHSYELKIESDDDTSLYNNTYLFNQNVEEKIKVLFISETAEDEVAATQLYSEAAEIDFYVNNNEIPYTIEELCVYDEYVLSNVDVRNIYNYSQFISSLDTLVSEFGKSLITIGNTYIQNNEDDETLTSLSNMLPVKFGNNDQSGTLVTIIFDISHSMYQASKFECAKTAAKAIVDNLDEEVSVMIIPFFGDVGNPILPTKVKEKEKLIAAIDGFTTYNGTYIGAAIKHANNFINNLNYSKNQVILISDGCGYDDGSTTSKRNDIRQAKMYAEEMRKNNIKLSVIQITNQTNDADWKSVASLGGGDYYYLKDTKSAEHLILDNVLNVLTDVVLDKSASTVQILKTKDELVSGIESLPDINGLYNNTKKSSATVVLEATYTDEVNNSYKVPLYTYWNYGNGQVSSFASKISGKWVENWGSNETSMKVLENIPDRNIPDSRVNSAFIINTNTVGTNTQIIVNVPSLNYNSQLNVEIKYPNQTVENKVLVFDSQNYITDIDSSQIGEYNINLYYQLGELKYETNYKFYISYLPEYNSFTLYDASNLYYMVSTNGKISEDGKLVLENNNSNVQKYILDFTPIFMIICVILFVIDIIVRKLRWQDIKSLFKFSDKKNYIKQSERSRNDEK